MFKAMVTIGIGFILIGSVMWRLFPDDITFQRIRAYKMAWQRGMPLSVMPSMVFWWTEHDGVILGKEPKRFDDQNGDYISGNVKEVQVHNRALSDDEIKALSDSSDGTE